jgi:hypothetical protein
MFHRFTSKTTQMVRHAIAFEPFGPVPALAGKHANFVWVKTDRIGNSVTCSGLTAGVLANAPANTAAGTTEIR